MLHVFDVDHTIVKTSTVKNFIREGMRRRILPMCLLIGVPWYFFRLTFAGERMKRGEHTLRCLRNLSREELENLAVSVCETYILPHLDRHIIDLMEEIRSRGERIILASSSFRIILTPLAAHLGISEMVTNELEFINGVSTGRLTGLPVFRDGKRIRVLEFLRERQIEPEDCSFYSDSPGDLPLLQGVGRAVAVNPDRRLRRCARRHGWDILDTCN